MKHIMNVLRPLILFIFFLAASFLSAQRVELTTIKGLNISKYTTHSNSTFILKEPRAMLSFQVDGKIHELSDIPVTSDDTSFYFTFENLVNGQVIPDRDFNDGWKCRVIFRNISKDTIEIENVVPFGEVSDHIYLTSKGPWALARAKIFRPDLGAIGVILPDNAWEMGYGDLSIGEDKSLCSIARRMKSDKAEWRRYKTIIYPGGYVEYSLWIDDYSGEWQNGLRRMFRDRWLYDLQSFDDQLYNRDDLKWIRHAYIIGLQFGWNQEYYDWETQQYKVDGFLEDGKALFGGYDVFGLWPTWPRLGVDERNQWDMFADLPGGLDKLAWFSRQWKAAGTKFFICYNPWDESTRSENPYLGMAGLIDATEADGVVLDCHGASSFALQRAADSVRSGVVMYSEGMAVIEDMPGIVAGRVHDAIYLPPPLNLNKLIKPDFAIFRVCQVHDGRIRREASIAFFNGYGTELNTFAPAQLENMEEDLLYLGKTSRILRENTSNFLTMDWTPLIPTLRDSIWVNKWPLGDKTIYTVFSLLPEGFNGPLFEGTPSLNTGTPSLGTGTPSLNTGTPSLGTGTPSLITGTPSRFHLVSLWHHENLEWTEKDGKLFIPARTEAFNRFELNTRTEGNIDCIALLPSLITAEIQGNTLDITATSGDLIRVWVGDPSYQNKDYIEIGTGAHQVSLFSAPFFNRDGKYVVQLFKDQELLDEYVLTLDAGTPRLVSEMAKTPPADKAPKDMVLIPAGSFEYRTENTDQFIPYPEIEKPVNKEVNSFYMDKYPVTNAQFMEFLGSTGYSPKEPKNFLKHWENGKIPPGLEDHPVVYVSLEDVKAYAAWAGKRLPTEVEWQYAASGRESYNWPWGMEFDSTRCNNATGHTTDVNAFPKGKSPFGVMDMTGNVWQFTGDVYDNGTYYYVIMKGGSHYKPTSSWWYVKGGPQPNYWHQLLLLVSPSFDRNATVGFRCVKDVGP
jgi:gamma-glutamyl hercynylcysteine S-oxide synthase